MKQQNIICIKCGIKKDISEFCKRKTGKLGIKKICKVCNAAYHKEYRKVNEEKNDLYHKLYRKTNQGKRRAYSRDYGQIHKEERKEYGKIYWMKRRKADPLHRLTASVRTAIGRSLKGNKKGAHWEDLVGYTIEKLRKHLEKQFVNGMSWENYGEWHIDHKIPVAVFNFTKPEHEDFKRCWALSNLQPLWALDNVKKHAKINNHFQPSLLI